MWEAFCMLYLLDTSRGEGMTFADEETKAQMHKKSIEVHQSWTPCL